MRTGTYTLLVDLDRPARIRFGAAGERGLDAGWYAYTGSAFGPGGFSRIERHRTVTAGENETRHWHVDYLLGHPDARLAGDVRSPGLDVECEVAQSVRGDPIPGIGASDCDCGTHLVYSPCRNALERSVRREHRRRR